MPKGWVALAAVLLLSGCVGVPTSGGVEPGPVIDERSLPGVDPVAQGPVPGSEPQRIINDFMQAVRSSRADYAVARQFMTAQLASEWEPTASTVIRTGQALTQNENSDIWSYTVTSRAAVDAEGRYQEAASPTSQTFEFTLAQVGGQWRIAQAPDGIVLSESGFDIAFQQQPLYFFDASHRFLVPDVRWFPSGARAPTRVVRALLGGPADWLAQGVVQTAFPVGTQLGEASVTVSGNGATIDLNPDALASSPQERGWMRQQLAATLGVPDITLTVGGLELPTPDPGIDGAILDPSVESAALVRAGDAFGFDGGAGLNPLPGLSEVVGQSQATAAVLSREKRLLAFTAADGVTSVVSAESAPVVIDARPDLAPPSIDPFDFIWSAQRGSAASLRVTDLEGAPVPFTSGLPTDTGVVSMDVSRDGTRVLLYLTTPGGPALAVAGIIRENTVPSRLGPLQNLPVGSDTPVDATWVDDQSVAALTAEGTVTTFEIGGPSTSLGTADGATTIVGGNNGTSGLRVLALDRVWRPQGSGWVSTDIQASMLATKQ